MSFISRIEARNFRNFEHLKLDFTKGINVIQGLNGQGKTNLLEAVYFLSLLRSFRCRQVQNIKNWHSDGFLLNSILSEENGIDSNLAIDYREKRQLILNGAKVSRSSEFAGQFKAVVFAPEDIEIIKGGNSCRRNFIDILLSQLYPAYMVSLNRYNKALKSRNSLLRTTQKDTEESRRLFQSFDHILSEEAAFVIQYRLKVFPEFQDKINKLTSVMFGEKRTFQFQYQSSFCLEDSGDLQEKFQHKLQENFSRDLMRGSTTSGPHRDEIHSLLDKKNLVNFGSEGQCRLASLVLKMASVEILSDGEGLKNTVLLVDDVVGELDQQRRQIFLETVCKSDQVFIACTEIPFEITQKDFSLYKVLDGNIEKEKNLS